MYLEPLDMSQLGLVRSGADLFMLQPQIKQRPELWAPRYMREVNTLDFSQLGRGARLGRNVRGGRPLPLTPRTILGANLLQWCRADLGVTVDPGGGVSQWGDLSGNGRHYAQATLALQPAYGAAAGANGTPAVTFDGTDDILRSTLARPAPSTTPTWTWFVLKQITWTNTRRIFCAGNSSSILTFVQAGGSPGLQAYNAINSPVNADLPIGVWGAVQVYFSNTPADYIQVNDATPTTGNTGNNSAATGMTFGAGNNTLYSNIALSEIVFADVLPTASQLAALSAYRRLRYGF